MSNFMYVESARINKVYRVALCIRIAIEALRIAEVVAAVVRIRLIKSIPIGVMPAHHGVIATIRIAFVSCIAMWLKCRVAAARSFATPRVEINYTRYVTRSIGDSLGFGYRILETPVNSAVLNRHHLAAKINVTT